MASIAEVDLIQARADYKANLDYDLVGDAAKASLFIQACRLLLEVKPMRSESGGRGGEIVQFDMERLQMALDKAERYFFSKTGRSAGVKDYDLRDFRSGGGDRGLRGDGPFPI